MSHETLLLPHPVLRPDGFDYKDASFEMEVKARRADGQLLADVSFALSSSTLSRMVESGQARFFVLAKCARTYHRCACSSGSTALRLAIPSGDVTDSVKLTPYVVASREIQWFASDEHDDEIRDMGVSGTVPPGAILAVGKSSAIELDSLNSVQTYIKLSSQEKMSKGLYSLGSQGDSIVITMNPETYAAVTVIRGHARVLLYSSIYTAALEYAIHKMDDCSESKWAKALRKALEENGIDAETARDKANLHAQTLLKLPLAMLIEWHSARGSVSPPGEEDAE